MQIRRHLLFFYVLITFIISTQAAVWIWDPEAEDVFFHAEKMQIQWACEPNATHCDPKHFEFRIYQKQPDSSNEKYILTCSLTSVHGTRAVWVVPLDAPEGDGFFFRVFVGREAIETHSEVFSIRHAGLDVLSPSYSSIWAPSLTPTIQVLASPLFVEKNKTVDLLLVKFDDNKWKKSLGSVVFDKTQFDLDPSQIPFAQIPVGRYRLEVRMSGKTIATSSKFIIHNNPSSVCDEYGLAAMFSKEVYNELYNKEIYFSCGTFFKSDYVYSEGDNAVLIVSNPDTKVAFVSFRGTAQAISDWANSLTFTQVPCANFLYTDCEGGYLHGGFASSFNFTKVDIRVIAYNLAWMGYRIVLTGHSKGGAIATIQALDLLQAFEGTISPDNLALITFGTPRTGTAGFTNSLNKLLPPTKCNSIRYVGNSRYCGWDPVTQLPPFGYYAWEHAGSALQVECDNWCLKGTNNKDKEKRAALGISFLCHFMDKYVDELVLTNQGHPAGC